MIREIGQARGLNLRQVLRANSLFSGASGLLLLLAAAPVDTLLRLGSPLALQVIGAGLLGYAVWLYAVTGSEQVEPRAGWFAVVADLTWVVASGAILLSGWPPLSSGGRWMVLLAADVVALFAILQYLALRRMRA